MDPITLAGLGLGGLQGILGLFGANPGPRPKWQIPGAAYEQVASARQQAATTTRPGNQYAVDTINRGAGAAIGNINRTASSGTQALAAAGQVDQNRQQAIGQNNAQNANYSFNSKQNLQKILGNFAGLQREQFIKNVYEPYQSRVQTSNALTGAGIQNIFGTLNSARNANMQKNYFDAMFGGGQDQQKKTVGLGSGPVNIGYFAGIGG